MPFQETRVMDERRRFIDDVHRSLLSFSELCRRYGISRKTGYKWLARWEAHGPSGLEDRRSRPHTCPWITPPEVTEAILEVRRAHPDYGAKKGCLVPRAPSTRAHAAFANHHPQHPPPARPRTKAPAPGPSLAPRPTCH